MSLTEQQWCPTSAQVTVLQARGLRVKGKGGTNDAYALMQVGKEKYQTSVVEKSVAPVWREEAAFDLPPLLQQRGAAAAAGGERGTLRVHVLHRALVGPDKLLGQAVINLQQLGEDRARDKTEWFKLLDKTGKADKDRGEVLVDIQFTRNNMTGSMFDLSAAGKSRSRLGKFKDKVRGKKKESDTASSVAPSFPQVLTDSEEEASGEAAAGKDEKKKKNKMKSLFSHKSNLQKNMSQSMSVLPGKSSSLSGSQSSGLNVDSSDGKKKFKFMMHKRSGSSDAKDSSSGLQKHVEQSNVCINGSHVYCEEPQVRTSRIGSNFSLTSSGHGSMEDVPESSPPSVDSLRAVRQYSPWTEEEEEEEEEKAEVENVTEDGDELRKGEEEMIRMEEERRRKEEELERLAAEKKRQEEEERQRIEAEEENKVREEEEERILSEEKRKRLEEEEKRKRLEEEEERVRMEEEGRRKAEQEEALVRLAEEKRRREEEEERVRREEEETIWWEEKRKRLEEEERVKMEEERRRKADQEEALVMLAEEKRQEEEERVRREEEERILREEERKRQEEEERVKREEQERKRLAEEKRLEEQETKRIEEEEQRRRKEAERVEDEKAQEARRRQEEEEENRRMEEEESRIEEEKVRKEEERAQEERRRKEEEELTRRQEHETKRRLEELERRQLEEEEEDKGIRKEEKRRQEEEERARKEKEEYEIMVEDRRKLEEQERERIETEEKIKKEEEERKEQEAERVRVENEEREEKRRHEERERRRIEEEEQRQREEDERMRQEEERRREEEDRLRREKEEYERLVEEKRRLEEQERRQREEEERIRREEEEKAEKERVERLAEEKRRLEEQEKRRVEEEEKLQREEEEEERRRRAEKIAEEAGKLEDDKLTDAEERKKREDKAKDGNKTARKKSRAAVESHPAEVASTNPFDETFSNNPFEDVPTSKETNVQQRRQSAVSSAASESLSADKKELAGAQREKRPAPRPPGRNTAESQREPDASKPRATQTASVLPQRSGQSVAPPSCTDAKDPQSSTQSGTVKGTASVAKPSKRPAPSRPCSLEEEPSAEPKGVPSSCGNVSQGGCSETKRAPVVYGLNPFDDDEDELAAQGDTTTPGNAGSTPASSQTADEDAAAQARLKSSKAARAPPPPAKTAATPSTLVRQNADGGHATDAATGEAVPDRVANQAHVPQSEAVTSVRVKPVRAQSAAEAEGVKKEGPPAASRRLQPVKPLNPPEQQSVSIVQGGKNNKSTAILSEVQDKTKVNDSGLKGPFSQLTQLELISLVLKQENQLSGKDKQISELEQYIDDLLVRVIEEKPSILMSLASLRKAV